MNHTFSIAIDGPAGAGKSTVARALAKRLDAMYLDTGAMYRAFGLALTRMGVDVHAPEAVAAHINSVDIAVDYVNGGQRISIGGEDVTEAVRTPEAAAAASAVSAVPQVRARMVALQQQIARGQNVVMDGRDIGTVVLPDATLKVYLTASAQERAKRRCRELEEKGMSADYAQVLRDIEQRDWQDTHRAASPLQVAEGAIVVDTSDLDLEGSIQALAELARRAGIPQ